MPSRRLPKRLSARSSRDLNHCGTALRGPAPPEEKSRVTGNRYPARGWKDAPQRMSRKPPEMNAAVQDIWSEFCPRPMSCRVRLSTCRKAIKMNRGRSEDRKSKRKPRAIVDTPLLLRHPTHRRGSCRCLGSLPSLPKTIRRRLAGWRQFSPVPVTGCRLRIPSFSRTMTPVARGLRLAI